MPKADIVGQRYGRLTVIAELPPKASGKRMVMAKCDCGKENPCQFGNLKSGNTTSCGCAKFDGFKKWVEEFSKPQEWAIDGEVAYIVIGAIKVLIDAEDVPRASKFKWHIDNVGYVDTEQGDASLHRLVMGLTKGDVREVDHRYHVLHDDRKSELRIATSSQNKMNARGKSKRISRFKGVSPDKQRGGFRAQIKTQGRQRFLGRFASEFDAAIAYDREAVKHFGEFAWLNFPPC